MENELVKELTDIKNNLINLRNETEDLLKTYQQDIKELYDFIEMTEAMTTDKDTASRIRTFLIAKGIWK